jgi:hypothetical protein
MKKNTSKKRREEHMPLWKAIIILIVGILLTAGITSIFYSSYKIRDYKEFDVYIKVAGKTEVGFNLDPGVFNFGKVPPGGIAKRNATISHGYPEETIVKIEIEGKLDKMIFVNDNYFILPPNITKQIEVVVTIPEDQPLGNYSGKLKAYFMRQ